jgi:hypothetical protein
MTNPAVGQTQNLKLPFPPRQKAAPSLHHYSPANDAPRRHLGCSVYRHRSSAMGAVWFGSARQVERNTGLVVLARFGRARKLGIRLLVHRSAPLIHAWFRPCIASPHRIVITASGHSWRRFPGCRCRGQRPASHRAQHRFAYLRRPNPPPAEGLSSR